MTRVNVVHGRLQSKDSLGMLVQAFPKRVVRRRPTVWFGSVTRQSHVVCRRGLKNDGVIDVIALVVCRRHPHSHPH